MDVVGSNALKTILAKLKALIRSTDSSLSALSDRITSQVGSSRLETNVVLYTGTTTMTKLFNDLSTPCIALLTTENVTDKPSGKYGIIIVFKVTNNRISSICLCTDGSMYCNSFNTSTNQPTGWK